MNSPHPLIAIVEDDDALGQALDRLLGAAGFATRRFVSAEAFLELPDSTAVACLLLDIHLPGADGFQLLDALHRRKEPPAFPIVLMTADDSITTRRLAERAKATAFLVKPIEFPQLLRCIPSEVQHRRPLTDQPTS